MAGYRVARVCKVCRVGGIEKERSPSSLPLVELEVRVLREGVGVERITGAVALTGAFFCSSTQSESSHTMKGYLLM